MERGQLSGRGYHRVRRVARTIADLDGHDGLIDVEQVALALEFRRALSGDPPDAATTRSRVVYASRPSGQMGVVA